MRLPVIHSSLGDRRHRRSTPTHEPVIM